MARHNNHAYKRIMAVVSAFMTFICMASESETAVSEVDLRGFFESIERKGTNILLTTHGGGGRFVYKVGDSKRKVSEYGETITLPENSELKIFEHHHSLTFSPLSEQGGRRGFRISFRKDLRWRRGGNLSTNYAYMVYLDEKPDSSGGEKGTAAPEGKRATAQSAGAADKGAEKKCLKGLTLLPCEE